MLILAKVLTTGMFFFSGCSDKEGSQDISTDTSITEEYSDVEIQELINSTDMSEEERASLEEELRILREECANGD